MKMKFAILGILTILAGCAIMPSTPSFDEARNSPVIYLVNVELRIPSEYKNYEQQKIDAGKLKDKARELQSNGDNLKVWNASTEEEIDISEIGNENNPEYDIYIICILIENKNTMDSIDSGANPNKNKNKQADNDNSSDNNSPNSSGNAHGNSGRIKCAHENNPSMPNCDDIVVGNGNSFENRLREPTGPLDPPQQNQPKQKWKSHPDEPKTMEI